MKGRRQSRIIEILKNGTIETQEELAAQLKKDGFEVTQATVSRDIKEMGLIKVPGENKTFRYTLPGGERSFSQGGERLKRLFRESVIGIDNSENLIVIRTQPGEAQGVASAIDQSGWKEIIGTVGGDDTILAVTKPKRVVSAVMKRLKELYRR